MRCSFEATLCHGLAWISILVVTLTEAPASSAASISLTLSPPTLIDANDVTANRRLLEVEAREEAAVVGGVPTTEAKVFVYPLLHDSPDTSVPVAFGTLPPGDYTFRMRLRMVEPADRIRVMFAVQPGSGDGATAFADVPLGSLSTRRWYEVVGAVTVTGPDVWNGRLSLVSRASTGAVGNRLNVRYDGVALVQDDDTSVDGCDPDCLRAPLDFEADPIGALPDRVLTLTLTGTESVVEVRDNLAWQALPAWYEANRVQLNTRLRARGCICSESADPAECALIEDPGTFETDSPTFLDAADFVAELGVGAFGRHVKWGPEGPWWPTAVPAETNGVPNDMTLYRPECVNSPPAGVDPDIAQTILDRAHLAGTRVLAYYWMLADHGVRLNPPDGSGVDGWSACDSTPQPPCSLIESTRGYYLTQNAPYPEAVVEGRLEELVERGADAISFDSHHNPIEGDWSSWSAADFAAAGFGAMPLAPSLDDPQYWRLLDLYHQTIRSSFHRYHRAIHATSEEQNPPTDTALLVSTSLYTGVWEPWMRSSFVEEQQIVGNEWHRTKNRLRFLFEDELGIPIEEHGAHLPARDLQSGFGFTLLRDSANGRPPLIWVFKPASVSDLDLTASHLQIATTGILTYGGKANLDLNESRIRRYLEPAGAPPPLDDDLVGGPFLAAAAFGNLTSPALGGLRPHRWVGIHFNEHARQEIYENGAGTVGDRYEEAWNEVLAPAVWSFSALMERGVPSGIVTDEQLARGELGGYAPGDDNAYEILFLPSLDLRPDVEAEVLAFKAAGGTVVCSQTGAQAFALCSAPGSNGQPWTWHAEPAIGGGWDTSAREAAIQGFFDAVSPNQDQGRLLDAPIEIFFVKNTETASIDVAPHIGAYIDPGGSGRMTIAVGNRWEGIVCDEDLDPSCTYAARRDFVPPEVGGAAARLFLRGGIVSGAETYCYSTLGDPAWKTIDANHLATLHPNLTIIKLDDGDADPTDDLNFQYGLLIEVKPGGSCS